MFLGKRMGLIFAWGTMCTLLITYLMLNHFDSGFSGMAHAKSGGGGGSGSSGFLSFILGQKRKPPMFPKPSQELVHDCNSSLVYNARPFVPELPIIYVITPTYSRREQVADITRLAHTLLHVDNVIWVVAEDSQECSGLVEKMLQRFGMPYAHMTSPMPNIYRKDRYKPRGVASRRAGLKWVLKHHNDNDGKGIVYFADDDNTYDLALFDEIRKTERVSVLPVGFVGGQGISSPVVENGKVIGFTDDWFAGRKFPVDMAGFAVSVDFVTVRTNASMPYWAGYEEDVFLQTLGVDLADLEPLASQCTEVLVWHTKTVKVPQPKIMANHYEHSNLNKLLDDVNFKGAGIAGPKKGAKELKYCMDGIICGDVHHHKK